MHNFETIILYTAYFFAWKHITYLINLWKRKSKQEVHRKKNQQGFPFVKHGDYKWFIAWSLKTASPKS